MRAADSCASRSRAGRECLQDEECVLAPLDRRLDGLAEGISKDSIKRLPASTIQQARMYKVKRRLLVYVFRREMKTVL